MKTHQGYQTSGQRGAKCNNCKDWIPEDTDCVLMLPATLDSAGRADMNATAIHGILCMECYESK